jgi:hypothetical protein
VDLLTKHNMTKDGNKELRIKRLVQLYVKMPNVIDMDIINYLMEDYVGTGANPLKEKYLAAVCNNQVVIQENALLNGANTHHQTKFGTKIMELVYYAHKLGVFPTTTNIFLFGKEYAADLVMTAVNSIGPLDLLPYRIIGTNGDPTRRKTNACMLQLFLILITNDTMYKELMLSKTTPTRAAMDEGAVGDKSEFWAKACSKFLDNDYSVPDFPIVDYPKSVHR